MTNVEYNKATDDVDIDKLKEYVEKFDSYILNQGNQAIKSKRTYNKSNMKKYDNAYTHYVSFKASGYNSVFIIYSIKDSNEVEVVYFSDNFDSLVDLTNVVTSVEDNLGKIK